MGTVPVGQGKDSVAAEVNSDIVKAAEEAQIEASAELLADLRQMMNEVAFSDVEFVCSDGKRVKGSRIILTGRSAVLKSMFMNGMVESSLSEIPMPEISSPVLLSVFEFLYTGTLSDYHPQTWRGACEVISASRFFLLPKLEKITRKFMDDQTVSAAEDLPKVASMLTEAVGFKTMCEETDVSLRGLVTILSSNWSEENFVRNLSEDAYQYLLARSKGVGDWCHPPFIGEYLRFRQVIRWWVHQSDFDSPTTEELVSLIAPDEEHALSICRDPNLFHSSFVDSGCLALDPRHSRAWSSLQLNKASRDSVCKLLTNINCQQIPPVLLTKVVEPLQFLSSAEILNAFRYHALQTHLQFKTDECVWTHGESYSVHEHGYVLRKTGPDIGVAVAMAEIGRSYAVCQWSFVVEKPSETFCELGFLYYETEVEIKSDGETEVEIQSDGETEMEMLSDEETEEKIESDAERLSDQHRARVLKSEEQKVAINWEGRCGGTSWKALGRALSKGSRVLFTFDPVEHTCSLAIDDKYFGVVWKHLPSKIYFPAVSLGSSKGRVRIELGSGFDII